MQKKENNLATVLNYLEGLIQSKKNSNNTSYTSKLVKGNINRAIQKALQNQR